MVHEQVLPTISSVASNTAALEQKPATNVESAASSGGDPPAAPVKSIDSGDVTESTTQSGSSKTSTEKSRQWIKLGNYSGRSSIEAFIRRFEICAANNGWSSDERLNQLLCSLTEPANQLLFECEASSITSWTDLVQLLRSRYGSTTQVSLYQTQLATRKQKEGEDLNVLVQDIRRLLTLGYPGPASVHRETIAIRAFLDALRDKSLALKVREREPGTLDDAYKLAMRLDCYQKAEEDSKEYGERRHGRVHAVKETALSVETVRRLLKEELESCSRRLEQLEKDFESLQDRQAPRPVHQTPTRVEMPSSWTNGNRRGRTGNGQRQDNRTTWRSDDRCFECHEVGHYARSCPNRSRIPPEASNEPDQVNPVPSQRPVGSSVPVVSCVSRKRSSALRSSSICSRVYSGHQANQPLPRPAPQGESGIPKISQLGFASAPCAVSMLSEG